MMKNERNGEWSGVYIDFLEELKKKENFSYTYVTNDINSFDDVGELGLILVKIFLYIVNKAR